MTETDVLVIGSGFAGLWAAISARDAGASVAIVDKGAIARSSQSKMSAGATIYCLPEDDVDAWVGEFAAVHGYLCRQDFVADMLETSGRRLARLEEWGVAYDRNNWGYTRLPSRGFQQVRMLVLPRWRKRVGGAAVTGALREQVVRRRVTTASKVFVTGLVLREGRVAGAVGIDRYSGDVRAFAAGAVVLAGGDCSFRGNYACADAVTGDAFGLALDAGARLANMEFLCSNTGSPHFGFEGTGVATRFGGSFVDARGKAFMAAYDPEADRAEVNVISQAMAWEVEAGHGPPFRLDMTSHAPEGSFLRYAFSSMGGFMPLNIRRLAECGVDVFARPQEWAPAVQTLRGGVRTDLDGLSDVPGLFATGLTQAVDPGLFNGWSSMRAMWGGERAGAAAARWAACAGPGALDPDETRRLGSGARAALGRTGGPAPDDVLGRLQEAVFPYRVSILKDPGELRSALDVVEGLEAGEVPTMGAADPHELAKAHETANMVRCARLYLLASLAREESRGDHFRVDHPDADNEHWLRWANLTNPAPGGPVGVTTEPVPLERYRFRPAGAGTTS